MVREVEVVVKNSGAWHHVSKANHKLRIDTADKLSELGAERCYLSACLKIAPEQDARCHCTFALS